MGRPGRPAGKLKADRTTSTAVKNSREGRAALKEAKNGTAVGHAKHENDDANNNNNNNKNNSKKGERKEKEEDEEEDEKTTNAKRKGLVRTQFQDVSGEERKLVQPFVTHLITEEALARASAKGVLLRPELVQARVNYNLQKNRSSIVSFEGSLSTKPDDCIAEFVRCNADRRAALARILKSPTSHVHVDDDSEDLGLGSRDQRRGHEPSTSQSQISGQSGLLTKAGAAREQPDSSAQVAGSFHLSNDSPHVGSAFTTLSQRMDKKIKFEREQVDAVHKAPEKAAWKGWTMQRISARKRAMVKILQNKADAARVSTTVRQSQQYTPKSKKKSQRPTSAPLQGRSAKEKIMSMDEAVREAQVAACAAEIAERQALNRIESAGAEKSSYLRRSSVSVRMYKRIPEHLAQQHPRLSLLAQERKSKTRSQPARRHVRARQQTTQFVRSKVRHLNSSDVKPGLRRQATSLPSRTISSSSKASGRGPHAHNVDPHVPETDFISEAEAYKVLAFAEAHNVGLAVDAPARFISQKSAALKENGHMVQATKAPVHPKKSAAKKMRSMEPTPFTMTPERPPKSATHAWIEKAMEHTSARHERAKVRPGRQLRPQSAPAHRRKPAVVPSGPSSHTDGASLPRRPSSARPEFDHFLRARSRCASSLSSRQNAKASLDTSTPVQPCQVPEHDVVAAKVEAHIESLRQFLYASAMPVTYTLCGGVKH